MNIFHKVALQGLKKNRTRTLVTIVGVALSAALITAVAAFAVSLQNYMINGAVVKYGDWHIMFPDVDSAFVQEQAADSRAADVTSAENIGYAVLEGGENPDKPYLFISGFDRETFDMLPISILSGRMPENGSEILVPAHVAANGGVRISVGDTLTLRWEPARPGMRDSASTILTGQVRKCWFPRQRRPIRLWVSAKDRLLRSTLHRDTR